MTTEPTAPLPDAETLPFLQQETPPAYAAPPASAPLPRTRWAAIVWGLYFATIAWFGIWMLSSGDRRTGVTDWFASLTSGTITALALLSVGVLVLITGAVGLIRHAQRRGADRG